MSEEVDAATTDEEVTPATSGPEGTPATEVDSPDVDYKKRYSDLRSDYDRKNQEQSEFQAVISGQSGPEAQAEALRQFGIEVEDDEDDEDDDATPYEEPDPDERLEAVESALEAREAAEQQEQVEEAELEFLTEGIEILEQEDDREYSEQEMETLASIARANPNEQGTPDLRYAHSLMNGLLTDSQERYIKSKKVSRRPGQGTAADEVADLSDPDARQAYMAERFAAIDQDE